MISHTLLEGPIPDAATMASLAGSAIPLTMCRIWESPDHAHGESGDPDPEKSYLRLRREHNGVLNFNGAMAHVVRPQHSRWSPAEYAQGMARGFFTIDAELRRYTYGVVRKLVSDGLDFHTIYCNVAGESEPTAEAIAEFKKLSKTEPYYAWRRAVYASTCNLFTALGLDPSAAVLSNTISTAHQFGPSYPVWKGLATAQRSCIYGGYPDNAWSDEFNLDRLRRFFFEQPVPAGPVINISAYWTGVHAMEEMLAMASISRLPVVVMLYLDNDPSQIIKHVPAIQRWCGRAA